MKNEHARSTDRWLVVPLAAIALATWSASCGGGGDASASEGEGAVASVTPIRGEASVGEASVGEASVGEASVALLGRASRGDAIAVEGASERAAGGLARVQLDLGPSLLLDAGARVTVVEADRLRIDAGRVLATAEDAVPLELELGDTTLRLLRAALSASVSGDGAEIYVIRGEVAYRRSDTERGVAHAGELLRLARDAAPTVTPATLFSDWTSGLFTAGPSEAMAPGVGVLEARTPGELGEARWPLSIRRLDVQVSIEGDLAITEVEEEFFNPASETVEGLYRMRVPEGAVLQRFAVDRGGRMVEGFVREQAQARAAYQAQVYQGSTDDPALLEWDTPSSYRARIYPIAPGSVRRIAVRYVEWLHPAAADAPRIYRFPMGEGGRAPHVQELSFVADVARSGSSLVRAGMGAVVSPSATRAGRVELRRSDFRPRSDLVLELTPRDRAQLAYRAPHTAPRRVPGTRTVTGEADERDYFYLPLRLPDALFASDEPRGGLDLVLVADVSAATSRAELELGRSVAEALAGHLGPNDRVSIVTADLAVRGLGEGPDAAALAPATPERIEALLDALARVAPGGATDLGAVLAQAAALLDPSREGAIVYIGDGTPTVGELGADGLATRLLALPHPARLYAIGVGNDANLGLLSRLTRGGGLALRVEERESAAEASLELLAHLRRPILQRVSVELGAGLDNAFPRAEVDVVRGDVIDVVARVRDNPPESVTVRGLRRGAPFEETIAISTRASGDANDLRLRWANERLGQLLASGASREEIAELGTRTGVITPYTSYYVPSARELSSGLYGALDHAPLLGPLGPEGPSPFATLTDTALGLLLGPLALTGCTRSDAPPPSAAPLPPEGFVTGASGREEAEPGLQNAPSDEQAAPVAVAAAPAAPSPPADLAFDQRGRGGPAPPPGAGPLGDDVPAAEPSASAAATDALGARYEGGAAPAGGLALRGTGVGGGGSGSGTIGLDDFAFGTIGHGGGESVSAAWPGGDVSGSGQGFGVGSGAERRQAMRRSAAAPSPRASSRGGASGGFVLSTRTTTTVTITTNADIAMHERRACSDASRASLEDRRALWAERFAARGSSSGFVDVYLEAGRRCELPTSRDRRAILETMLDAAGSLPRMIELYSYLPDATARTFFRSAILRRVRTADDLRRVRDAFGLGASADQALVEQVLARASTPEGRLAALRRLVAQTPTNLELRLRLLEELEAQHKEAEAVRLAERLRTDPLADPGARTAVGELYLRLGREDDARRTFSEIVEFQPMDELARRRLGDLYRAHGWFEDAYRQYQTLVSIRPDDPSALLLLAQAAAGAGRIDEALRLEQRVMETSQRGAREGVARAALLWSSVRFAELRKDAEARGANDELDALLARMRRSGVLRGTATNDAPSVRASLVWAHPDANLALYAAYPGLSLTRPNDLYSELGVEAFDVEEQESAPYRIEIRRDVRDRLGSIAARLVVVWNEGRDDEQITVLPLTFDATHRTYAYSLTGRALSPATPSAEALRTSDDAPSVRMTAGGAR